MENSIWNQYGEKLAILNTENIKIWGLMTKLEVVKYNLLTFSSISAEYLQKILVFNFPKYSSIMPKVRWVVSMGFVANFIRFPAVDKF